MDNTIVEIKITDTTGNVLIAGEQGKILIGFCKMFEQQPYVKELLKKAIEAHDTVLKDIEDRKRNAQNN